MNIKGHWHMLCESDNTLIGDMVLLLLLLLLLVFNGE